MVPTPANHSRSAVRRSSGAGTLAVAHGPSLLFAASRRSAGEQKSEETLADSPSGFPAHGPDRSGFPAHGPDRNGRTRTRAQWAGQGGRRERETKRVEIVPTATTRQIVGGCERPRSGCSGRCPGESSSDGHHWREAPASPVRTVTVESRTQSSHF